jgi:anion-transporting  ArsA/GET3 family ATPase
MWKKGFYAWENATANYMEEWIKSPLVLQPSGQLMSTMMKARAAQQKAAAQMVAAMGLSTRHDQERVLHALNQIQSRLLDIEEKLEDRS